MALLVITILLFSAPPDWATCGGGGGGGGGGMSTAGPAPGGGGGAAPDQQVYNVPWKLRGDQDPLTGTGLMLVWFPSSNDELKKSSLRISRTLALYSQQCVAMQVATPQSTVGAKLAADAKLPLAVLATPDGTPIGKAENKDGFLKVDQVEKLVESEMKKRESALDEQLKDAKAKAKSGDNDSAITIYKAVLDQKCLFPNKGKDAAKELKKLGVKDVAEVSDGPIFDHSRSKQIEHTMWRGYKAELDSKYLEAEKIYLEAHQMDPADVTPLRFLAELYRHEIGDWDKARAVFEQILAMPADPLSIAVAQHGLGKMTIHEGN